MTAATGSVRHGAGADAPCPTGKIRHTTAGEAEEEKRKAADWRKAGNGNGKVESRVYFCHDHCGGWHVTSRKLIGQGGHNPRRGNRRRGR